MALLDPSEFEQSTLAAQRLEEAQAQAMYVDNGISDSILGQDPPFPFTLRYRDGQSLVIPLAMVFFDELSGAKITTMRKHAASGRIVPFQASQSDPGLRDPSLSQLPADEAITRVLRPRFDPVLTSNIVNLVLQAQSLFLAKGILDIIALRLGPPAAKGAGTAVKAGVAGRAVAQTVLSKAGTVTVEATLARNIIKPAGKLAEILKAIQPRFVVSPPTSLMQAYKIVSEAAKSVGLESGIVKEGSFVADRLVIQNVGNVTTTILKSGEVVVRQADTVLLRLIP